MSVRIIIPLSLLLLTASLYSQGLGSFLPAKTVPRAARLLATIDNYSTAKAARQESLRRTQIKSEAEAVESYALIMAARSSRAPWARPEGLPRSSGAAPVFAAARDSAKEAAGILASAGEKTELEAAGDLLASLILATRTSEKAALGLEKYLAAKTHDLGRLFPEALELEALLRRAGAAGAREVAAAMAHREAEAVAASFLASKARLLSIAPAAAGPFSRLEDSFSAYRTWIRSSSLAAYPGDLESASPEQRSALSASLESILSLGQARASSLLSALSAGNGRESAAAEAATRLAELWARSPAAKRRELAALCGLRESSLALFASLAAPSRGRLSSSRLPVADPLSMVAALNGLAIAIADEESQGEPSSAGFRGPEPALLLLERPNLASVARMESRYTKMYAEASRRLGALYAQAAEGAQGRLESSLAVFKAASLALGSAPTSLVVHALDLSLPVEESGRRIAFFAEATDSSGASVFLPLRAELAGAEYATAFARAAGIGTARAGQARSDLSKTEAPALLAKYGQLAVTAYDPEASNDSLLVDFFPKGGGALRPAKGAIPLLGEIELELALLEGWRP